MSNISLVKVGGVSAILSAVIFAVSIVVIVAATGGGGALYSGDMAQILLRLNANQTAYLVYNWLQIIPLPLGFFVVLGLYKALRRWGDLLWIAVLASVFGGVFFTLNFIFEIVIAAELAPRYAEASESTRSALEVMASTFHQAGVIAHRIGHVLIWGIGVGLFALAILRTSVAPKWVGWLGLFAALVAGWFGLLEGVSSVFEAVTAIGAIAYIVWMVAMGVVLLPLRLREPVAPATGA